MSGALLVREVDGVSDELVRRLTEDFPYDDYRRHRRIPREGALAYLRERVAAAAARERTSRLVAIDRASGEPEGLLLLQRIPSDSELLGLEMAGIPFLLHRPDHPSPREVDRALLACLPFLVQREGYDHVSVRLDSSDIAGYQELSDHHFRLMETMVSMAYDTPRRGTGVVEPREYEFDGVVRPVEPRDVDALCALAARSFTQNRYHLDEDIPKADAGRLMAQWTRNYCEDAENCQVWVAEAAGGRPAGFVGHALNRELEAETGVLVSGRALLAVADQRSRVGQMLARAHTWQSEGVYKEADTQLDNYGMIKVAFNLDMDMVRTRYTFHRSFRRTVGS